jgi:hypothetical protein
MLLTRRVMIVAEGLSKTIARATKTTKRDHTAQEEERKVILEWPWGE